MKVISMKFIFILTIIALAAVFFWSEDKGPACYQVSDEQARTFVKNDYLQRMKRWDNDVQLMLKMKKHFLSHLKLKARRVRECIMACTIVRRDMLNMRMTNTLL